MKVVWIGWVLCASAALIVIGPEKENVLLALIVSACGNLTEISSFGGTPAGGLVPV